MHPAISVIFFTVTSGAGFGFMAMLGLGVGMPGGPWEAFLICGLAGSLAIAGLIASTFHLGHPERAWRAFSQWRSSWLSREGVAAVVTLCLFGIYALVWMIFGLRIGWLGILIAIGSVATVFTTSMIYAQLKTVPHWNHFMTPICYLGFSGAAALLLVAALGTDQTVLQTDPVLLATISLIVAWVLKLIWWQRNRHGSSQTANSTKESATGLGMIGKVRLFEKPHTGENYLTKEMVHQVGRKHAVKLKMIALFLGFVIPGVLCLTVLFAPLGTELILLAFCFFLAGLFVERWLFFAEATHVVSLYY